MFKSLDMKDSVQNNRRKDFIGPVNQNDHNVLRNFLKKKHPYVTARTRGASGLWPAHGLCIHAGEKGRTSILINRLWQNPSIYDNYSSFNNDEFHYIASGTWEDWVDLARKIIAVDKSMKEFNK